MSAKSRKALLTLALSLSLALVASALAAQQATPRTFLAEILYSDPDGDGVAGCGDTLNYIVTFDETPPSTIDMQGVDFTLNYDPNLDVVPGSVIVSNPTPDGSKTILSGNSAGDRVLQIHYGHVSASMPAGNGAGVQFLVTIRAPSVGNTITMQGTFTGTNFAPLSTNVQNTSFTPCAQAGTPDMQGTKTTTQTSIGPGQTLVYAIAYRNVGTAPAAGATLDDIVPQNTTFDPANSDSRWTCAPNNNAGSACQLPLGTVAPGEAGAVTFAVTVVSPLPAGVAAISNVGCANAPADTNPINNCSQVRTPTTGAPDLSMSKTAGSGSVAPGATLTYTLAYRNAGDQDAAGVTLVDTVPANTTFSPAGSTAGWSCSPNNSAGASCTLTVGALAAGTAGSATFAVTVADPLPAGVTSVGNTACAHAPGDPNPANNCSTVTTPTTGAPNLTISKTATSGTAVPGATLAYTLSYSNVGDQDATGVTLADTVPANTTFSPAGSTAGWSCSPSNGAGASCTLTVGAVAAGAGGSATFAVTVANPMPAGVTSIRNTACVSPGSNCSTVVTPTTAKPDLSLSKTASSGSVAPGATLTYTLSYSNVGNQDAAGVSIADSVPMNTTFSPAGSTAGWSCSPNNGAGSSCTLTVGAVAAGTGGSVTFAVTVANPLAAGVTNIGNTACAHAPGDPNPGNDCSTVTTPTTGAPDLSLAKTTSSGSVAPGATLTYTLTYRNVGNQDAASVTIVDHVPANTTFSPADSTAGWTCSPNNSAGSTCTLTVGAVAAGTGGSATFAVSVANPLPTGVTAISNFACANASGDQNPANNCGSVTTPSTGAPDMTITKTASATTFQPGDSLTYTLAYRNVGNQDAAAVTLADTVPANTTFAPAGSTAGWSCSPNNSAGASCTLAIGAVPAGTGGSATFTVTVANPLPAEVTSIGNTACAHTSGDPNPGNDCSTVTTPRQGLPDISLSKTADATSVGPGGELVYTLTYQNVGTATAAAAVLAETVPGNSSFDPAKSTPGWSCSPNNSAGASCTLSVGDIAAGASGSVFFAVTAVNPLPTTGTGGPPTLINTACVHAPGDPNPGNDCSTVTTPTTPEGPPPPESIPTLGEWGLLGLGLAMGGAGLASLRRLRLSPLQDGPRFRNTSSAVTTHLPTGRRPEPPPPFHP